MPLPDKIDLRSRAIPKDAKGDPAFTMTSTSELDEQLPGNTCSQFSPEEITVIVNRYIRFQWASALTHRKLAEKTRQRWTPVKRKVREMFNVPFTQATQEQLQAAMDAVAQEAANAADE